MKLIRFGKPGQEKPGVELESGQRLDVSSYVTDFNEDFFADNGIEKLKEWLATGDAETPIINDLERLGCPVDKPSKIVCVGLNYAKHAEESGMPVPEEPVLFFKATTAITGPFDNVMLPKNSKKSDWEVELAVVIGKKASYVAKNEAMDHVAGYVLHNDISEREYQLERQGQWVKGKSCDTFAPLGPYLVPREEVPNPHNLDLWLKLNGETMQSSNTSDLVFNIPQLVSYISEFMTMLPGDVISTGTPFGVGLGLTPPKYLRVGDVMELGIDKLGVSKQNVVAFSK
ncbi:fumarylacetoacetate hydrolase family protein [Muricauda sp. SCSIO 64092]|uniref:fumarylacetoacetate hydrolase family protein n=1 Tax=Allomuricauda sp. SCSIO 64092 TaxID=2908842 RepID=UPI001FF3FE71|nr:fumarylacetoacetate hydrolase family protein [Muricauda sp. SCSIO 64092]UOY04911.1 fumarylacetoacetate hydrolase family protein [Muricauda sp. SCSIO 64092]